MDQALGLLAGAEPGAADEEGHFPDGTINARVVDRLREIAERDAEEEESEEPGKAEAKPDSLL